MAMTGAFTSTPTAALEALLDIRPLHVHLKQEALACAYRLHATGLWNSHTATSGNSHTLLWPQLAVWGEDVLAPSDMTIACSFPHRTFSVNIPSRRD